jgi:membrane-associated phospholipid phosphatase
MFSALGLYLTILWWRGPAARICTQTSLDEHIPFRPAWVWIYMIPYVLGPLAAALMRWDTLMWYLRRGIPVVLISNAIFIMLPTRTAEHPIHEVTGDDLTSRLYRNMAEADGPAANAAPSLHVSLSCLLAVALTRNWPRWWWAWVLSTALVVMSTLFTWQHHLIDVATGAAVGGLAALPWRTLLGRRPPIPLAPAFF